MTNLLKTGLLINIDWPGLVLGYTFWYIAQNPNAQKRIQAELDTHGINMMKPDHFTDKDPVTRKSRAAELDSLPYLRAVIDESLRMRPTSTPLPRITPSDRTVSVADIENIPPGTRINAFQWFVHRDPSKWDRVHDWCPDRWLERAVGEKKGFGEDVLWAFASGPRACLGNNLTYYGTSLSIHTQLFP